MILSFNNERKKTFKNFLASVLVSPAWEVHSTPIEFWQTVCLMLRFKGEQHQNSKFLFLFIQQSCMIKTKAVLGKMMNEQTACSLNII